MTLTSGLRDLHMAYPGEFETGMDTSCPAVFEHNPRVTKFTDFVEPMDLHYPLVKESNRCGLHMVNGFRMDMEQRLGLDIPQGPIRGELWLSEEEKGRAVPFAREDKPMWIINGGSKSDFTCKQWSWARWQKIVYDLKDRIQFVQVGALEHEHPRLDGVTQMIGRTTLRELLVLAYRAHGIVTGNSALMHIAACFQKPCVVVSGGREPRSWCEYPGQVFISNDMQFDCNKEGGCWRWRVQPLKDGLTGPEGRLLDEPEKLCSRPVTGEYGQVVPFCMDQISSEQVSQAIAGLL